ncbi:MAG: O-antigen ligase family protein [bacterium]
MKERILRYVRSIPRAILGGIIGATILGSVLFTTTGIVYNYINSKVLFIQIGCTLIIALGILIVSWKDVWLFIKKTPLVQAMLGFLGVTVVATMLGLDPALSFYGHFERGTGLLLTLLTMIASLSAVLITSRFSLVRQAILYPLALAGGLLGVTTWIGLTGFNMHYWYILGKSSGGGGTLGNSSFAGTVFMMTFFITLYLFCTASSLKKRLALLVIGFFTLVNPVIISLSYFKPLAGTVFGFIGDARGATLSIVLGLIVFMSFLATTNRYKAVRVAGWSTIGITIAGILIGMVMLATPGNKVHDFFVKTSGAARFMYWNMALKQTKDHLFLGTGPETFRYAHEKYFDTRLLALGEPWADKPHNSYVEIVMSLGVLGLAMYIIMIGSIIWLVLQLRHNSKHTFFIATVLGFLTAYLVNNSILFDTMTSTLLFFMILAWIAWYWYNAQSYEKTVDNRGVVEWGTRIVLVILVIVPLYGIIHGEAIKLSTVWKELFTEPPARMELYQAGELASPYGAGISFAQRADDYGQRYMTNTKIPKDVAIKDIEAINATLIDTMSKYPANTQSYIALGNLALAHIIQSGTASPLWIQELKLAEQGVTLLSPQNPRAAYFKQQVTLYEKK